METAVVAIEEGDGEGGRSGEAERRRDTPNPGVAFDFGPLAKLNLVDGHRFLRGGPRRRVPGGRDRFPSTDDRRHRRVLLWTPDYVKARHMISRVSGRAWNSRRI